MVRPSLVVALILLASTPVQAATALEPSAFDSRGPLYRIQDSGGRDPVTAALLSAAPSAGLWWAAGATGEWELTRAAPFTLGFGHVYAGDSLRGALVSAGMPAFVELARFGIFYYMVAFLAMAGAQPSFAAGHADYVSQPVYRLIALGTTIWAATDAYEAAERHNERLREPGPWHPPLL